MKYYHIELKGEIGEYGEDSYYVALDDQELDEVKQVLTAAHNCGRLTHYAITPFESLVNTKDEFLTTLNNIWA